MSKDKRRKKQHKDDFDFNEGDSKPKRKKQAYKKDKYKQQLLTGGDSY